MMLTGMTRWILAILIAALCAGTASGLQNPLRDRLLRNERAEQATGWYQRADTGSFFLFDRSREAALLRERAEVDSRNAQGETPIHVSSKNGHAQAVCALLASGAVVDQTDKRGRTALHHCCATHGGKDVADALMEVKADVNLGDNEGNTPLHLACATGNHRTVASLLKYKVNASARERPVLSPP